jgi:hypothetical protein
MIKINDWIIIMRIGMWIFTGLGFLRAFGFDFFSVEINDPVISASTEYIFTARATKQIDKGDQLIISLPSQYNGVTQSFSIACSIDSIPASCSYSYPNVTITIQTLSDFTGVSSKIIVDPIVNPSTAQITGEFFIFDYSGSELEQSFSCSGIEIEPKNMPSASLSTESKTVAANTTWTVSLNISQSLVSGSTIELTTPIWNKNMGASYTRYYCSGSVICTGKTGNFY